MRWLQRSVKGWSGRLASGQLGLETRFKLFFLGLVVCLFAAISRPSFVCLAGEPAVAGSNVTCSGVYLSSQRLNFRMLGFRLVLLATLGRSYPRSTSSQFFPVLGKSYLVSIGRVPSMYAGGPCTLGRASCIPSTTSLDVSTTAQRSLVQPMHQKRPLEWK